jgi:hypothetical protein
LREDDRGPSPALGLDQLVRGRSARALKLTETTMTLPIVTAHGLDPPLRRTLTQEHHGGERVEANSSVSLAESVNSWPRNSTVRPTMDARLQAARLLENRCAKQACATMIVSNNGWITRRSELWCSSYEMTSLRGPRCARLRDDPLMEGPQRFRPLKLAGYAMPMIIAIRETPTFETLSRTSSTLQPPLSRVRNSISLSSAFLSRSAIAPTADKIYVAAKRRYGPGAVVAAREVS